MSLGKRGARFYRESFPRVSGDEPPEPASRVPRAAFSPRERG